VEPAPPEATVGWNEDDHPHGQRPESEVKITQAGSGGQPTYPVNDQGQQPRAAQSLLPCASAAFRAAFIRKGTMRCLPYELRWRSFLRDLPANPPRTSTSSPARPFSWRRSAVVLRFWRTLREGRLVVSSGLVAGRWMAAAFLVLAAGSHQWGELLTCGDAGDRGPKSTPLEPVIHGPATPCIRYGRPPARHRRRSDRPRCSPCSSQSVWSPAGTRRHRT
jgi:hypothetical protein